MNPKSSSATAGGLRPVQLIDFPATLAAIINSKHAAIELAVETATDDNNLPGAAAVR